MSDHSSAPTPTPTRLGPIQAEAMSVAELLDIAATGPVVVARPFGADPVVLVAVPEAGVHAITAVTQALRSVADLDP